MTTEETYRQYAIEEYTVDREPFYVPIKDEIELFEAAYAQKIPVLLKGPTGCGKTRFIEHMAFKLGRPLTVIKETGEAPSANGHGRPLVTVACHEDLTASDLVGRYLLEGDSTRWIDGPITRAVKVGAICYLDEVVEARKDTTVLIHPLTDHGACCPSIALPSRRRDGVPGDFAQGDTERADPAQHPPALHGCRADHRRGPGDEDHRPRGRYHGRDCHSASWAESRHLKEHGLAEGVSTRLLIYAGRLIHEGIPARRACQVAVVWALTDDREVQKSIEEVVSSIFE
jgi:nitric oxide reductase NorQ protein